MIQNDEQLRRTRAALLHVEASLTSLYRQKADIHPDRFALMAEPILDQIQRLRAEIDEYIGVTAAARETVPVWLRLQGPGIELHNAPTSVVTAMIDLLRVGVQAVAEYLLRGAANLRPTALIKQACDLRIVDFAPGSVQVGLSLPDLPPELFEQYDIGQRVRESLRLYLQTAAWAGSDDSTGRLEEAIPDPDTRRMVLNQVARLVPRPRGQLEVVELSGRMVNRGRVQLRRETRQRVREAVKQTVRREMLVASGVLREIDLDERTFSVRDWESSQETRCKIPPESEDLMLIAKESLDYRVTVLGVRKVDPLKRQAVPLQVLDIDVEGREGEDPSSNGASDPVGEEKEIPS
jgi:hypothetical protein